MKPGRGKGRNEPPAMTARLVESTVFDYLDLVERHRSGARVGATRRLEARPQPVPSPLPSLDGIVGGTVCWSGWCPGCGRALISATTDSHVRPDAFYCSKACRP